MSITPAEREYVINAINENEKIHHSRKLFEEYFRNEFLIDRNLTEFNSYEELEAPDRKQYKETKAMVWAFTALVVIFIFFFCIFNRISIAFSLIFGSMAGLFTYWMGSIMTLLVVKEDAFKLMQKNKSAIKKYYEDEFKEKENNEKILSIIRDSVLSYARNQSIVAAEEVRKNGLDFLTDHYINAIMNEELRNGRYERIEMVNPDSSAKVYIYKSKDNHTNKISTTYISLD